VADRLHGDERILGESEFVEATLKAAGETLERHQRLRTQGQDLDWLLRRVAAINGLPVAALEIPGKEPARVQARSLLCYWAVRELGLPGTAVAARLSLTQSAVSRAVRRGERLTEERGWEFPKR
jgi:hypothetical protein